MAGVVGVQTALAVRRPCVSRPVACRPSARTAVQATAQQQQPRKQPSKQAVLAGAVAGSSALTLAIAPAALAAQEAFLVAEGEPLVVQLGWAALAASFSASLAFVVWGRSGL